jgi:acyl-homoserine lactone acylase PvdQ
MTQRVAVSSLLIAFLTAIIFLALLANQSPREAASSSVAQVTIYRDEYGIPHIYGDNAEAAAFGFGYAQAEDHLEVMREDFYQATGRLAEFGLGSVDGDRVSRLLHVPETAAATYAALDADHRARIDAFAAGVNRYILENAAGLPSWVLLVQPQEVLAWFHYGRIIEQWQIANSELAAGGYAAPGGGAPAVSSASNMWVVGPGKSSVGVPILHGDPHLPWTGSMQWYEAHLNYPGVNVGGATLFGYPGIAMGASDFFAWSMTNNGVDTADVYTETLNPSNPSQYLYDGSWLDLESEVVTIKVAGSSDRAFTNYYTHHGPVIGSGDGVLYTAALSTFEDVTSSLDIFDWNAATSIAAALPGSRVPSLAKWNILAADSAGNIFYLYNARVANKSEAYNWSRPVDGSTSATDWGPFLTIAELPQSLNPAAGYLQNANNSPWTTAPDLSPGDYPSYLAPGNWLGDRATRAIELMESQATFSVEEIKATGLDDLSVLARGLTPLLLEAWTDLGPSRPDPDGRLAAAIALIDGWDYTGRADSPVYALFRLWVVDFYGLGPSFGHTNLPPVGSVSVDDQEKMLSALDQAASFMISNFGRLDPAWGDVHKMKRGSYEFPLAGGNRSLPALRMTNIDYFSDGVWWATGGSSYLFVAALTDPVEFWSVRPLGESEDPESPHYADVSALYSANQYKQLWMTLADVLAHQTSAITLTYSGLDSDGDGCADLEEDALGFDPLAWYDFYDVPVPANPDPEPNGDRNQAIGLGDVLAVLFYVGTYDGDSGLPNPNGAYYDTSKGSCDVNGDTVPDREGLCYDRSPSAEPNPPWDAGPPDGAVSIQDVLVVLAQVGLDCSGPP